MSVRLFADPYPFPGGRYYQLLYPQQYVFICDFSVIKSIRKAPSFSCAVYAGLPIIYIFQVNCFRAFFRVVYQ